MNADAERHWKIVTGSITVELAVEIANVLQNAEDVGHVSNTGRAGVCV
jgi:hypothetical protein